MRVLLKVPMGVLLGGLNTLLSITCLMVVFVLAMFEQCVQSKN